MTPIQLSAILNWTLFYIDHQFNTLFIYQNVPHSSSTFWKGIYRIPCEFDFIAYDFDLKFSKIHLHPYIMPKPYYRVYNAPVHKLIFHVYNTIGTNSSPLCNYLWISNLQDHISFRGIDPYCDQWLIFGEKNQHRTQFITEYLSLVKPHSISWTHSLYHSNMSTFFISSKYFSNIIQSINAHIIQKSNSFIYTYVIKLQNTSCL